MLGVMLYRTMPTTLRMDEENKIIHLSSSSEYPVSRGAYTEVLDHSDGAVTNIARSVLYNHDSDWLIGSVRGTSILNKETRADIELLDGAKLPSGVDVRYAVDSGALSGVSIGYSIEEYERTDTEDGIEIRATKWTIREITLTPIPADHTVGIGRSEDNESFEQFVNKAAQRGENKEDTVSEPIEPQTDAERTQEPSVVDAHPQQPAKPAIDAVAVARHAESLGLRASDYLADPDWQTSMLRAAAEKRNKQTAGVAPVHVVADSEDKLQERTIDGLISGKLGAIVDYARAKGHSLSGWSRGDIVDFVFNKGFTRAAEVSANFSQVTALASQKAIAQAYDEQRVNWNLIANTASTGDFKTFRNAALQMGDLAVVTEGNAATDITIDDAGGSGALTFRARIIELTEQAIYNDELGEFFRKMGQMGGIGARHVEKSIFAALEAASFSSATAAIALGSAGLNTAWTNYMAINGPAGERRSAVPSRLVVPSALYVTAKEITTSAQGETTTRVFAAGDDYIMPVHAKYLTDANDWYLLADPNESPVITALFHSDYPTPQVREIDSGAYISRKFRIQFPFQAIVNNDATNVPMGGYKCTQA